MKMNLAKIIPLVVFLMVLSGVMGLYYQAFGQRKTFSGLEELKKEYESELAAPRQNRLTEWNDDQLRTFLQAHQKLSKYLSSRERYVLSVITMLIMLAGIVSGVGLLLIKEWARILAIWQSSISIALNVWTLWFSPLGEITKEFIPAVENRIPYIRFSGLINSLIQFGWLLFIIWVFTKPQIRHFYQQAKQKRQEEING